MSMAIRVAKRSTISSIVNRCDDAFLSSYPGLIDGPVISIGRPAATNFNYHLDMTPPVINLNWILPVGKSFTDDLAGVTITTLTARALT